METENEWLLDEIATGLQKLACLSLDRTPAAEILTGTAQAWLEAITDGRAWKESRDAARLRAGFRTLSRTARRWPSPAEFLDAVPRIEQAAIGYEAKPLTPDEARQRIADLRSQLEAREAELVNAAPEPSGQSLGEVERDLRSHYDGRAAAAGPDA